MSVTELVTADTITDEQIESLLETCDVTTNHDDQGVVDDCHMALSASSRRRRNRAWRAARARCAEIINARRASEVVK